MKIDEIMIKIVYRYTRKLLQKKRINMALYQAMLSSFYCNFLSDYIYFHEFWVNYNVLFAMFLAISKHTRFKLFSKRSNLFWGDMAPPSIGYSSMSYIASLLWAVLALAGLAGMSES